MTTVIDKIARVVDRKVNAQPNSATIVRVDHGYVDIALGPGSGVIHHVLVQGNIDQLAPGMTVPIQWEERQGGYLYPVVIATGGEVAEVGAPPVVLVDNDTIRVIDGELSIKPGGIDLEHLAFVPAVDGHSHPSELAQAGFQVQEGVLQNVNQDLLITGSGRIEAGEDLYIDGAHETYRLWAGDEDPALAAFSVAADGTLVADLFSTDAANIAVDTTNFAGNLSATDDTVQKALDTLDDLSGTASDDDAIHDNVSGEINALTEKVTPVDDDLLIIEDSAASSAKKKVKVGNLLYPTIPTVREILSSARTYYVRTDGSNGNDGLSNTAGGAFQTIQKAVDVVATLDINGQTVTIQVGNGTYTATVNLKNVVGYAAMGNLVIQGDTSTPTNVVISTTSTQCFNSSYLNVSWDVKGFKLQTTTSGYCLQAAGPGSTIRFYYINFGAAASGHIRASRGGVVLGSSNYTISGNGGSYHILADIGSRVEVAGMTVTFTANCTVSVFASAQTLSNVIAGSMTFTLGGYTVTGSRYSVSTNGVLATGGGGANYFPGNSAGSAGTGGQYT